MYDYLTADSIPPAVLILSKYQYQSAFVADQEINLSGQIKPEAGGLLPEAVNAFNLMKQNCGCDDIFIKETDDKDPTMSVSYRSYEEIGRAHV